MSDSPKTFYFDYIQELFAAIQNSRLDREVDRNPLEFLLMEIETPTFNPEYINPNAMVDMDQISDTQTVPMEFEPTFSPEDINPNPNAMMDMDPLDNMQTAPMDPIFYPGDINPNPNAMMDMDPLDNMQTAPIQFVPPEDINGNPNPNINNIMVEQQGLNIQPREMVNNDPPRLTNGASAEQTPSN